MTREEAINVLRQVNEILVSDKSWLEDTHEPLNTVFDMAIEALKDKEAREQYEKWEAIEEEEAREYFEGRKQPNAPQRDNGVLERVKMQESCEDCISRESVMVRVKEYFDNPSYDEKMLFDDLVNLPPVTPQPKMGEWLKNGELCKCSRCGSNVLFSAVKLYNYCYRCGAKMEVKE